MKKFLFKVSKVIKSPKLMSKYIIVFTAVLHLLISHLQIQSISLLNDQICGFVMFFFILFGFACLFNAIRMVKVTLKKLIFSLVMLLITLGFGGWLLYIYFSSLQSQMNLAISDILPGIIVSLLIIVLYLWGIIELIIAYFMERNTIEETINFDDSLDDSEDVDQEEIKEEVKKE